MPGQSATLNGTTFEIPPANGTSDNVVSSGQSILMPPATRGENIYLLATSTCGAITGGGSRKLSIKYRVDGEDSPYASSTDPLSTVPDWLATPPTNSDAVSAVRLGNYLSGSAQITSGTPTLYVLKFPVYADYFTNDIVSVTLPRVGTTYTKGGCGAAGSNALHVFAMSVGS